MAPEISNAEQVILLVFCGFILAINLSLVFAFVRRNRRPDSDIQSPFGGTRKPWQSKYEEESAELRRVAGELRKSAGSSAADGNEDERGHSS